MFRTLSIVAAGAAIAFSTPAFAQGMRDVKIKTVKVTDHVYMLMGRGGNIGLCVGEDGTFMIDDQFAPLTGKILAAISEITDKPVEFLLNTHYHGDHTGGNENFSGEGATIIAHENVRARMSNSSSTSKDALPVITFSEDMTFHYNGDSIHIIHVDPAHTDGDSIVHFVDNNVFHMGDTYFVDLYPYIDVDSGGSIDGLINVAEKVMKMANKDTMIIPGHGELTGVEGLKTYRDLLKDVRDEVVKLIEAGKNREAVIEANPSKKYDEVWGQGFMSPEAFIGLVYDGLTK